MIAVTDSRRVILSSSACLFLSGGRVVFCPRARPWRMLRSKATRAGAGVRVDEVVGHHVPSNRDVVCLSVWFDECRVQNELREGAVDRAVLWTS